MDYSAPAEIKPWLECLFWSAAFCSAVLYIGRALRGPAAHPPNELLNAEAVEIKRRLDWLEAENVKVWEKMERDRVESLTNVNKINVELSASLSAIREKTDAAANTAALLRLKIDQFK